MSQIFIDTMARAITDYRLMLRRNLDQPDRRKKLAKLNLNDPAIFKNAVRLYQVAWSIVNDIEAHVELPTSYYSYSGMAEFARYLKEYLNHYEVENGRLVHFAQKASKTIVQAIQMLSLPAERLFTPEVAKKFKECSEILAKYGSAEQKNWYRDTLKQKVLLHPDFFPPISHYFERLLKDNDEKKCTVKSGNAVNQAFSFIFNERVQHA